MECAAVLAKRWQSAAHRSTVWQGVWEDQRISLEPINIHGPKPYKFIGFGDSHGPKPYLFIGFGDIHAPQPPQSGGPSQLISVV